MTNAQLTREDNIMRFLVIALLVLSLACSLAYAQDENNPGKKLNWKFTTQDNRDFSKLSYDDSGWQTVSLGYKWKSSKYAWFRCTVSIPAEINGVSTEGKAVGLKFNACDGGECYLNGKLFTRFDNDHPALLVLTKKAKQGDAVPVAVRAFMGPDDSEHDGSLGESNFVVIDKKLIETPFVIKVNAGKQLGALPKSFAGVSQGAGLPDYDDSTAAALKETGIKWFRMDNLLTNAVKKGADGKPYYDWSDLDKRLDFMKKADCEFIFCISYMPEPYDAIPDGERHSYPRDWNEFGELVYQAAKHCIDHGTPVKYWEVWNEINTGWMRDPEGWDHLKTYTTLYDICWKAVRRADPKAWIGGPCVASGPWNENDPRGPGVKGEKFMRGLLDYCEKTGAPLDFVTWHEYFQPHTIMKKEAEQIKAYLNDYPKVKAQVKEYAITEWNYAWWHDRAHDNEVGAAWTAASVLRGWMATGIQKPCFFLAKDFSSGLRGEWGLLTRENKPKAVANVCRMFNMMSSTKIECIGEDEQIAAFAAVEKTTGHLTVLVINFGERYGAPRKIRISIANPPKALKAGAVCKQYLVDVTHSNLWNDESRYNLEMVKETKVAASNSITVDFDLANNGVTMLDLASPK